VFGFLNAFGGTLTGPYPSELFPTGLRTTAVVVGAAASRIGAAVGTFLLPIGLDTIGTAASMLLLETSRADVRAPAGAAAEASAA
jgi:MFS transporter, putative metabolite transport protein